MKKTFTPTLLTYLLFGILMAITSFAVQADTNDKPLNATTQNYVPDDHSMGGLELKQAGNTSSLENAEYNINSVSEVGNVCDLSGKIHGNVSFPELDEGKPSQCKVEFVQNADGSIEVSTNQHEDCQSFCGHNAYFTGRYIVEKPTCTQSNTQKVQQAFQSAYNAKQYAKAEKILATHYQQCNAGMYWLDDFDMRNNLAVTYLKLGKTAECRAILEPYKRDFLQPTDRFITYLTQDQFNIAVKNAKYNWQQCSIVI